MPSWKFKLLYDGNCPICRFDVRWMTRLDNGKGRLAFENIQDEHFDPAAYGKTLDDLMGALHGVFPDGRLTTTGAESFRQVFKALDLGWVMAPTAWPVLSPITDAAYRLFARHRLTLGRIFGGPGKGCQDGVCKLPTKH